MKQIVDDKQRERLLNLGIIVEDKQFYRFKCPTIGELIEWCDKNSAHEISIGNIRKQSWEVGEDKIDSTSSVWFTESPELIDALVELAIKIKESQ